MGLKLLSKYKTEIPCFLFGCHLCFFWVFNMSRISRKVINISSSKPSVFGTGSSIRGTTSVPITYGALNFLIEYDAF